MNNRNDVFQLFFKRFLWLFIILGLMTIGLIHDLVKYLHKV